jgi:hypothetical protein
MKELSFATNAHRNFCENEVLTSSSQKKTEEGGVGIYPDVLVISGPSNANGASLSTSQDN